jgi:hypothetical protein
VTLSLEAERERYQQRKKDPAFLAYKAAYARAWKAAKRGDSSLLDAHRAKRAKRDAEARALRERRLAERASYRAQFAARVESKRRAKRMAKASTEPSIIKLREDEMQRIDAIAREIRATEQLACPATTTRGGFRVACILSGEHERHVGVHGDRW